jgi:hypothetical protein
MAGACPPMLEAESDAVIFGVRDRIDTFMYSAA